MEFNYSLQFEDGTWYTGYALTLAELMVRRSKYRYEAFTYTEQQAHKIKGTFPTANLTVVRVN